MKRGGSSTRQAAPTRLRRWRLAKRLTIEELADLTGISSAMLSRVERQERRMSPGAKAGMARALGVRVRDLFDVEQGEAMDGAPGAVVEAEDQAREAVADA